MFHVAKDYLLNAYAACLSKLPEVSKSGSKLYSTSSGIRIQNICTLVAHIDCGLKNYEECNSLSFFLISSCFKYEFLVLFPVGSPVFLDRPVRDPWLCNNQSPYQVRNISNLLGKRK